LRSSQGDRAFQTTELGEVGQSVWLSCERLVITAKLDVVDGVGAVVAPVDYRGGKRPHVEKGA
jgi:hypothetical protein